jgi:hypothetical protein
MNDGDKIPGFDRRTVLKSAAVAVVGAGALSGTASANVPDQINFCGCSQVCVTPTGGDDTFQVVLAKEPYDQDDFKLVTREGSFCYELAEDSEYKIVGVRGPGGGNNPDICNPQSDPDASRPNLGLYCNPDQCAQKAIDALGDLSCSGHIEPECLTSRELNKRGVDIVLGRCGKPGRDAPPGRQGQNGPPE